jgi:ribosomal protein L6P/L9E
MPANTPAGTIAQLSSHKAPTTVNALAIRIPTTRFSRRRNLLGTAKASINAWVHGVREHAY